VNRGGPTKWLVDFYQDDRGERPVEEFLDGLQPDEIAIAENRMAKYLERKK
jgi:hypothetical protein